MSIYKCIPGICLAVFVLIPAIAQAVVSPFSLGTTMPPAVASDTIQLKFNWEPARYAVRYRIELSENVNFEKLLLTKTTASNMIVISNLPAGRKLYWRVWADAKDGSRVANSGGAVSFTTPRTPPIYKPVLIPHGSPKIDGIASTGEWDKAPMIELETFALGTAQPTDSIPVCRMMWDQTSIYILCKTGTPGLRAVSPGDGLEVFLQEAGDDSYISFAANVRGDKLQGNPKDASWTCNWQAANHLDGTYIGIEVAIPWTALSAKLPKPGDKWRGNLTMDFGGWRGAVVRSWSKVYFNIEDPKAYHAFILGK